MPWRGFEGRSNPSDPPRLSPSGRSTVKMDFEDGPAPGRDRLPHPSEPRPGMPAVSVIIHERVGNWSRRLRPRFQGWPIRWAETRSADSLARAVSGLACPILVVDLDRRTIRGLFDLDEALQIAPNALSVVLDPLGRPEVVSIAREVGATLVLPGQVVPPEVDKILQRWLPIARGRSESQGWSASAEHEPEAWEDPDLFRWPDETNPITDEPD